MKGECRQVAPRRIAARQLHHTRSHGEPEEQPQHQPDREAWRIDQMAQAFASCDRREKDGEKPRFEQQRVPLIGQKIAAHDRQG